ncbi:hypothetical protein HKBW3S33_01765, partial [Candidatus Hakubella thermalkaliphila]
IALPSKKWSCAMEKSGNIESFYSRRGEQPRNFISREYLLLSPYLFKSRWSGL